jgi:hypothetical protein
MKLANFNRTSPSWPRMRTLTRWEGGASRQASKSCSRDATLTSESTAPKGSGRLMLTIAKSSFFASGSRGTGVQAQKPPLEVHDVLALLLFQDLAYGTVLGRGDGQPQ